LNTPPLGTSEPSPSLKDATKLNQNRTNAGVNAAVTKKKMVLTSSDGGLRERERVLLLYFQIESESKYESTAAKESPK